MLKANFGYVIGNLKELEIDLSRLGNGRIVNGVLLEFARD